MDCVPGSTTKVEGANHEDLCARPGGPQGASDFQCLAGQVCRLTLGGFSLQDGHKLAVLSSGCFPNTLLQVPNVPDSGMSKPATQEGSLYVWGEASVDFVPEGGFYGLCWCPNMHDVTCMELQDFQISAGQLRVVGPLSAHVFQCARGQDCAGLGPVQGVGLSANNYVSIRSEGCGSARSIAISPANTNGTAYMEIIDEPSVVVSLAFGESILQEGIDHRISIDADTAGYDLCWCGLAACLPEDFVVPLGKLRVDGPRTNQEVSCAVGHLCSLTDVQSVRASAGDRIMVLTACGAGFPVPGFPGGGIAEHQDAWMQGLQIKVREVRAGVVYPPQKTCTCMDAYKFPQAFSFAVERFPLRQLFAACYRSFVRGFARLLS